MRESPLAHKGGKEAQSGGAGPLSADGSLVVMAEGVLGPRSAV